MTAIRKIGLLLFLALAVSGCVRQSIHTPSLAEFPTPDGRNTGIYYVPDSAGTFFAIPVGFTTAEDEDRVLTFTVSSPTGAHQDRQYRIDSMRVRIPAGKTVDAIIVRGMAAGLAAGSDDTLLFRLVEGDAAIFAAYGSYTLILKKYCTVVLDAFTGELTHCRDKDAYGYQTADYTVHIAAIATGPFSAQLRIENLSAGYFGPFAPGDPVMDPGIGVDLDWSDPGNFRTLLPEQPFYVDPVYGPAKMGMSVGSFSACSNTLILQYTVAVAAGSFGRFETSLKR